MTLNTFTDGQVLTAGELNENFRYVDMALEIFNPYDDNIGLGVLKWSATRWQTTYGLTTDGGVTWSSTGYSNGDSSTLADISGSSGIAFTTTGGSTYYTTDQGATWTAGTTSTLPNWNTTQYGDISMGSSTVGVIVARLTGIQSAYTTDGGDTWTQSSTGLHSSTSVYPIAVDMFDGSTGYMLDSGYNIWKTTDGGANWTDTTYGASFGTIDAGIAIKCLDASTVMIANGRNSAVKLYDDTASADASLLLQGSSNFNAGGVLGIVGDDNNNYYAVRLVKDNTNVNTGFIDVLRYNSSTGKIYRNNYPLPGQCAERVFLPTGQYAHRRSCFTEGNYLYIVTDDEVVRVQI